MDMPWGTPPSIKFATNVGLITTNGPHGHNIASMEWSHHISYQPGLVMVNVHDWDATSDNILASKEFGVNLAADDQNVAASIAGNSTGKNVDKIAVLKELGVIFTSAKKINAYMVEGAALQLECKLVESRKVGDHMLFIGEVVELHVSDKNPLIYHGLKFYKLGEQLHKPDPSKLENIKALLSKHTKKK